MNSPRIEFEPEACKECLIKVTCTKNHGAGTLCEKAHKELRELIFSCNKKDSLFVEFEFRDGKLQERES